MTDRAIARLTWLVTGITVAAGIAVADSWRETDEHRIAVERFQQATGGLGGGPTVDMVCPVQLDPRLEDACQHSSSPLPGTTLTCPRCGRGLLPGFPPRAGGVLTGRNTR